MGPLNRRFMEALETQPLLASGHPTQDICEGNQGDRVLPSQEEGDDSGLWRSLLFPFLHQQQI